MPNTGSPEDAVHSTAKATEQMKEQLDRSRKQPGEELGLSPEEVARRKKEAAAPRKFVSTNTKREFDVKSSSRAQQIVNQGIDKTQREKRLKDFNKNLKVLRKMQFGLGIFALCFIAFMAIEFLLPQYAAVQQRNHILRVRAERARDRMEELARQKGLPEGVPLEVHGGVAKITKPSTKDENAIV